MPKAPFERVFSKIDRRNILRKAIYEGTKFFLKDSKQQIFLFKAQKVDESLNLSGAFVGKPPRDFEKVTALFYLDKERYFITTRVKKGDIGWSLLSDQQFYRLNRREAYRIQIPPSLEVSYHLATVRNIEINRKLRIIEISSGGARVYWDSPRRLSIGSVLRGSLQWGKGKVLPMDAEVVHQVEDGIFGLRFVHLTPSTHNRLKILCLETQMELGSR